MNTGIRNPKAEAIAMCDQHLHAVGLPRYSEIVAKHNTPRSGREQIEYHWQILDDEPVICHLDYSPAERGARERGTGLQLEPDYEADCTLCAAYVAGVDIAEILSQDQCREIERLALEDHQEEQGRLRDEAAIERHRDMLDNWDAREAA